MEPALVRIPPFAVAGLKVRTTNQLEQDPARARIPGLWQQFMEEQLAHTIENALPNSPLYGVYGDYENGKEGEFDVFAGVQVAVPPNNAGWLQVPSGWFLRFDGQADTPEACVKVVIGLWQAAWAYFDAPAPAYKRNFNLDFERYLNDGRIELHVGVTAL